MKKIILIFSLIVFSCSSGGGDSDDSNNNSNNPDDPIIGSWILINEEIVSGDWATLAEVLYGGRCRFTRYFYFYFNRSY